MLDCDCAQVKVILGDITDQWQTSAEVNNGLEDYFMEKLRSSTLREKNFVEPACSKCTDCKPSWLVNIGYRKCSWAYV